MQVKCKNSFEKTESSKLANTLTQAASRSGLSVGYLRKRIGKELKITRFGRAIRILESDLVDFLSNGVDGEDSKD